jgi:chemotaxis protein MotB
MSNDHDAPAEQIIIIRRRGHEDEHGHGGAWKIAYADFMTAMMAFFLVMWLINASNTETKASVASYFNPIRLTDSVARRKGLLDLDEKKNSVGLDKKSEAKEACSTAGNKQKSQSEPGAAGALGGTGHSENGQAVELDKRVPTVGSGLSETAGASEPGRVFRNPISPFGRMPQSEIGRHDASSTAQPATSRSEQNTFSPGSESKQSPTTAGDAAVAKLTTEAQQVMAEVQSAMRRLGISGGPALDVTIEGNNIVMSLTDTAAFGMFAVGSAEPNELLVRLMQGLTPMLVAHSDKIILRGHTDSRPFRGDPRSNNWRLAMSRAEAAYAILLRAGVDEARFERIEAHADRKPKIAKDTQAAANRRIEIIMRRSER